MQNVKAAVSQIDRLLATFPAPSNVDARTRFGSYLTAVEDYDAETIVRSAVTNFLKGQVTDHNPAFAPSPAQLASECRRILNAQITEQQRHKAAVLQIEQREEVFHEDPPLLRKMTVERELARFEPLQAKVMSPEEIAAKAEADRQYLKRHDAAFVDMSPEAMRKRLHV